MKKVLKFLKKSYSLAKSWIVANGVEGVLAIILGIVLWIASYKIWAGVAFGVFASRNWDIFKAWLLRLLK